MAYAPIESYGLIGNLRTAALVGIDGSIDWLCLPHFDSPSVLAAILDDRRGGRFRISATHPTVTRRQFYWPDTNVLLTRFHTGTGLAEVLDFMPMADPDVPDGSHLPYLLRYVRGVDGQVELDLELAPAFNFARASHRTTFIDSGAVFESDSLHLGLASTHTLTHGPAGSVGAKVTVSSGQCAVLALHVLDRDHPTLPPISRDRAAELLRATIAWWRAWARQCTYTGRWREQVLRSAMALKLMTFAPTGAMVAAPTCSLPAIIGGERNWDYRYTWIRDAAFTVYALIRVGFAQDSVGFMRWVFDRIHELDPDGMLQPCYRLDGGHDIQEHTLDHLDGYKGSRPVRVGNAAFAQLQLDTAGELMDAAYLYNKYAEPVSFDHWEQLVRIIEWTCNNWRRQDRGLWEVRGPMQDFVYSKMMCWVALDRGLRLAEKRSFPADVHRWREIRNQIYLDIMRHGWNPDIHPHRAAAGAAAGPGSRAVGASLPLGWETSSGGDDANAAGGAGGQHATLGGAGQRPPGWRWRPGGLGGPGHDPGRVSAPQGRGAFVQAYGSSTLDAANLIMPLVFFVSPQDPRILGTIDAVMAPTAQGGLTTDFQVHRYRTGQTNDGLRGQEEGFNICTFWLIEALTRAGKTDPRRLEQARLLFEKMLLAANHVGLYAEQTGPRGEALGNFPQAFTHLSFISAAFNLDRVLGGGSG